MLEARVEIEPTHKGFADPAKDNLNTLFRMVAHVSGRDVSEFCPTSLA